MRHQKALPQEPLSIRIRPLYREEFNDALKLIHLSIREINAKDYSPNQLNRIVRSYRLSMLARGTVIVAEHRNSLVGVAKSGFNFLGTQSIEAVFTHPDFLGRGIGRALVLELERRANLQRVKTLSVLSSITAVEFYQKLSYERLGKGYVLENVPCVVMQKQLRPKTILDHLIGILLLFLLLAIFAIVIYACVYFLIYGG